MEKCSGLCTRDYTHPLPDIGAALYKSVGCMLGYTVLLFSRASSSFTPATSFCQRFFFSSLQQLLLARVSPYFTPATSYHQRVFFLHSNNFLPKHFHFFTPATSLSQSVSISSFLLCSATVIQFWDFHFKVFLLAVSYFKDLSVSTFFVLGGLSDALSLLPLFFYATIS